MKLTINHQTIELMNETPRPLLWVLRDELGLTGTKFGCGVGICGSCTVHVDGVATRSCTTDVTTVADKAITTIEGMAQRLPDDSWQLHPVQQAFLDEQAAQCGFCTAGLIVAATALLKHKPQPSTSEIRQALARNLCRCGAHPRVMRAVQRAAQEMAP